MTLVSVTVGLSLSLNAYATKKVRISSDNTAYSDADVQKLATTAVGIGVEEPISLNSGNSVVTVPDNNATKCAFKVGNGDIS